MKEPWLAVILSSFFPGIGQWYSGNKRRGILFIYLMSFGIAAFLFLLSFQRIMQKEMRVITVVSTILLVYLFYLLNLFDAYRCTKKTNGEEVERARKQGKDPWLAVFLTRIVPGLGHIYVKKSAMGIVIVICVGVFQAIAWQYSYSLRAVLLAAFMAVVCYDAYRKAPIRRESSNRIIAIVCLLFFVLPVLQRVVILNLPFRPFQSIKRFTMHSGSLKAYRIKNDSMKPTLLPGDRILARKVTAKFKPLRGDPIIYTSTEEPNKSFVSRVAALADETIEIKNGAVHINSNKINAGPFNTIEYQSAGSYAREGSPFLVPKDSVFVLGDNSRNSKDSRFRGPIPQANIIGKAYMIYWPISRIGSIK